MNGLNSNEKSSEQCLRIFQQIDETLRFCLGALVDKQQENNKTLTESNEIAKKNNSAIVLQKSDGNSYQEVLTKIDGVVSELSEIKNTVSGLQDTFNNQVYEATVQLAEQNFATVEYTVRKYPLLGGLCYIRLQLTLAEELTADTEYIVGTIEAVPSKNTPLNTMPDGACFYIKAETGEIVLKAVSALSVGTVLNISGCFLADYEETEE